MAIGRIFGLIGYPLTHSFSQAYFFKKFKSNKIEATSYKNFEIKKIEEVENILKLPQLVGINITIPYKQLIIQYTTHQSPEVQAIGACNCIHLINNKIIAYNTDNIGIENTLLSLLGTRQKISRKKALILGTGGASLAVQYVLKKLQIDYLLISRTKNNHTLVYNNLNADIMQSHQIIINTTPLGTYPNTTTAPNIPYPYISEKHLLFDLVYNPPLTTFLRLGQKNGATIVNGLRMLESQAEESWKIWNKTNE